ncbi:MAG TPA: hypothetical protein VGL66_15745 [Caulobacteraceae bacterium]
MDIHKPKLPKNWREFLSEIGIIVIGVLIALGAEQTVAALHDRQTAAEARRNVRAEAQWNVDSIQERLDTQACLDQRLDKLSALLSDAREGPLKPPPSWVGRPPTGPMFEDRWLAATASGRNSNFAPKEQENFGILYGLFSRYNANQAAEQLVWAHLRALEGWQGPLGPAARLAFAHDLEEARYEAWDLHYSGVFAIRAAARLGLHPANKPAVSSICLPLDTPRPEATRRLGGQVGQP